MSIRNCPECGKLFEFFFKNLCPDCIKKEEGDFEAIVAYLKNNPGVGITEISEATGIGANRIIKMLKSGRLITVCEQHGILLLNCGRCGKPIAEGQFCLQCRNSMSKVLSGETRETGETGEIREIGNTANMPASKSTTPKETPREKPVKTASLPRISINNQALNSNERHQTQFEPLTSNLENSVSPL